MRTRTWAWLLRRVEGLLSRPPAYFTSTVAGGVKFGGTAATKFSVESDSLIIAIAPAKTAGPQPVTVQNSAGTSTGTNITYA